MKQEIIRIDLDGVVNCYLGRAGENFILFDTGGHTVMEKQFTNRRELLEDELRKAGCKPGALKLVVLTHGDNDHVANAAYIREMYQVKIAMHSGDLELVENPDITMFMESFHYRSLLFKIIFLLMKKLIIKVSLKILNDFENFTPDILIDEGFSLSEYGFDATVLCLPGHTAGSIGILTQNGELIAGDTFSNTTKPEIAPNGYNFKLLAKNIEKLRKYDIKTVYPGHGKPFQFSELKK